MSSEAPIGSGQPGPALVVLPRPSRLVLLGDLHGRWERAQELLRVAEVIDAAGVWCAPPGTVLVQAGDLIDGRVTGDRVAASDPERAALVGAHASWACVQGVMALGRQAREAGGQVVALRGNHEQDLLSGAFRWVAAQKTRLMALAGISPQELESLRSCPPGRPKRALFAGLAERSPELRFLFELPVLLRCGPVLVVHGGPCRSLLRWLDAAAACTAAAVGDVLAQAHAAGPDHPLWVAGDSLLSPDAREDDPVANPGLVFDLLQRLDASLLAVGHSPFLGLQRGGWWDVSDPAVAGHMRRVLRLGPGGRLIKLDADLKRQPAAGAVVLLDFDRGRFGCWEGDGRWRDLLTAGETLDTLGGGPAGFDEQKASLDDGADPSGDHAGVDAAALAALTQLLDTVAAQRPPPCAQLMERLRAAAAMLLDAEAADLAGIVAHLRAWSCGDAAALERVLAHLDAVRDRAAAVAARLVTELDGAALGAFSVEPAEGRVEGRHYRLESLVLAALRAHAPALPPGPLVCVRGGTDGLGRPAVRLGVTWPQLRPTPPGPRWLELTLPEDEQADAAAAAVCLAAALRRRGLLALEELEPRLAAALMAPPAPVSSTSPPAASRPWVESGELAPGPRGEPAPPGLHAAAARLVELNAACLAEGPRHLPAPKLASVALSPDRDGHQRGLLRLVLQGHAEPVWALRTPPVSDPSAAASAPGGHLLLANEAFLGLGLRWRGVPLDAAGAPLPGEQTTTDVLLSLLPCGVLRLHTSLRPEVAGILRARDWHALGGHLRRDVAPWSSAPLLFTTPARDAAACFHGAATRLTFEVPSSTLATWLGAGVAHLGLMLLRRELLTPRWGSAHVVPEVVALGAEGIAALWERRGGGERATP